MHIVQLDTDSLTLAISGDKNREPEQRFDAKVKDIEFYNKNQGFFYFEDNQRKILRVHIEKYRLNCIALSPKNYITNDDCGDVSLVAKHVILRQNLQIFEQTFVDNFKSGTVMKGTNTILAQKNKIMSRLSMTKNRISRSLIQMLKIPFESIFLLLSAKITVELETLESLLIDWKGIWKLSTKQASNMLANQNYENVLLLTSSASTKCSLIHIVIIEYKISQYSDNVEDIDQLHIDWHAIFKPIWEAAIKYACESKICH
ncbi:MAG: hypothetical protein EZS28_024877 [Streblomastix strix]|uniref:Uncharacterized protein n=1 Tax=Streblomastix strix TaxID=222440 RepID=A0A5J4VAP9_9EUKA|nr:MAG: hypothetical protein EZS28_024877 [Streblomastix strix]